MNMFIVVTKGDREDKKQTVEHGTEKTRNKQYEHVHCCYKGGQRRQETNSVNMFIVVTKGDREDKKQTV